MKNLTILSIICLLVLSCRSQEKDLAKITFTEKYDTFFGNIPNQYKKNNSLIDYNLFDVYDTESEGALNFSGVDLSGYRDKKGEFGTNYVSFEFSKKDKILNYYHVTLFNNKNVHKLIDVLNNNIGRPVYISKFDKNDKSAFCLLWEDKSNYYTLTGANQNTPIFAVFKKTNIIIQKQMFSPGDFQYYGDYLKYLTENNKTSKQISYYKYAKIMETEGNNFYIDNYVKP
jgi:hypothetical protein